MNANELAEMIELLEKQGHIYSASILRQQQAEIEALKKEAALQRLSDFTQEAEKTLTDDVVNELWAESQEDGIAMQQGFTTQQHYFAYLILRKASEK